MNRLLALVLMFGVVGVAGAQDEKKKAKKKAGDGAAMAKVFEKLDANADKKVTKEEFAKFDGAALVKPGKEDKAEKKALKGRDEWFTKLDADKDGSLTAEEFAKLREAVGGKKKADK